MRTVLLLWTKPQTHTNFLCLNQWSTLLPCNLNVIVRYYVSTAPFPLLFSVDMFSTQKGETGIDKYYNWNVGKVTGLSEKWDISLGDMNKLNLLWILQNWCAVNISKPVSRLFLFRSCSFKNLGFLLFFIHNTKIIFLVKVKNQTM